MFADMLAGDGAQFVQQRILFGPTFDRAISGAELLVLRNAGHLTNIEQPALFNRVLKAFLDSLPR